MSAPDYVAPILGWRAWRVCETEAGIRLQSVVYDETWQPGHELRARCLCAAPGLESRAALASGPGRAGRGHHAPTPGSPCGIYAVRDPRAVDRYLLGRNDPCVVHRVIGVVALWGRVVEAAGGWRASRAYPARLFVPLGQPNGQPVAAEALAVALAEYGVPVQIVDAHKAREVIERITAAGKEARAPAGTPKQPSRHSRFDHP